MKNNKITNASHTIHTTHSDPCMAHGIYALLCHVVFYFESFYGCNHIHEHNGIRIGAIPKALLTSLIN